MGNRTNQKKKRNAMSSWNSDHFDRPTSTVMSDGMMMMMCSISIPKMSRDCKCELCMTDKKVEEFFTKKRYWWTHR